MRHARIYFLLLLIAVLVASVGTLHAQEDIHHLTTPKNLTITMPAGLISVQACSVRVLTGARKVSIASQRNDITTQAYGHWGGSYTLNAPKENPT